MTAPNALFEGNFIDEVPQLRRYARVLTGNLEQADRLVLATLDCARRKHHRRQERTSLRTWLFTIMHRLHGKQLAHLWRKLRGSLVDAHGASASTAKAPAAAFRGAAEPYPILVHLARLPAKQREVLLLVVVERLAYAEAASVLGVSVGTVLARLNRAREAMRL
jgi:RNA polymerase sigma-70 factor (ECF subfamily)